ncbi:MAG: nucleotidyltransferase family protein, partial [Clostridia bacterium]|nr:nucleotidyltransferase family protein [Clostridia bacterium]
VLRQYYPQPWLRTSCDIDILIHKNDLETAKEYLVNTCGYTCGTQSAHDVSFFSEDHTHIELHYDLIEYGRANAASGVLNTVWDACTVADGKSYQHLMSDEMFYFYHVAHMAKHLEEGGCGIRPFIDLWILDNIEEIDKDKRTALLEQGNLLKFAETARALSKVWIDNAAHTETTEQLENYILSGGVYGSSENRITVQQQKKVGRFRYALSKIFLPYEVIKFHYPILEKHKWLTPFMEVRRWFKLIFCGHAKRSLNELKCNNSVSSDTAESVKRFMENIGL